jgi:hypothetical protein
MNIQFEFLLRRVISHYRALYWGGIKIWMSAKHQADQQQILRIYAVFHVRKTIFIAYMNAKGTLIAI